MSLRKSKHILLHVYKSFRRKKNKLEDPARNEIYNHIKRLETHILNKEKDEAESAAKNLETLAKKHLKKTPFDRFRDLIIGIVIALIIAIFVRQMWFELYEIPTGSMRPTLQEKDRLLVTKTPFGLNIPLTPKHLIFEPEDVTRGGIVVFTGENMDIYDVDTTYFYLFPGKKRFVKRLIAKPGDTLYFYGGQIYGFDTDGKDISDKLNPPLLTSIDHIPFIQFDGKALTPKNPIQGIFYPVVFKQMNEPIAKLTINSYGKVQGEMLPPPNFKGIYPVKDYYDLWGFKNYGMARLLDFETFSKLFRKQAGQLERSDIYLEITHHPSLQNAPIEKDMFGRMRPNLNLSKSIIPLKEEHQRAIFENIYTARFIVENGFVRRYGSKRVTVNPKLIYPRLIGVPDGTYQFYHGKGYEVKWQGVLKELPSTHPLMQFNRKRLELLFNLGIEFDIRFRPTDKYQPFVPSRYAYFRDHSLYLMGKPILDPSDPVLTQYIQRENDKAEKSVPLYPYNPFIDQGPPLNPDGSLNTTLIKEYGLIIPEKHYLALGDNYAMSADSRDFGFVPQENLRGAPLLIFWPPGPRFGLPFQVPYPLFSASRLIVWAIALIWLVIWYLIRRKRTRLPLDL